MIGREQFRVKFVLARDSNLAAGEFRGMASVFGSRVQSVFGVTIVEPGAFRKTLREHGEQGVKLLWQHDPATPIGKSIRLREIEEGLEIQGRISGTRQGEDVLTLVRDGVVDELSIGFDAVVWEMVENKRTKEVVRHLKEVRLHEISFVTFAADPQAKVREINVLHSAMEPDVALKLEQVELAMIEMALAEMRSLVP